MRINNKLFLSFLFFLTWSGLAYAQTQAPGVGTYETTMGQIIANSVDAGRNKPSVINLMWSISVLVGIIFIAKGLIQLIRDTESGSKSGISNGLLKIFGGALLVSLSTVVTMLLGSWLFDADGNQTLTSTGAFTSASSLSERPDYTLFCPPTTTRDGGVRPEIENMNCGPAAFANFARDAAGPMTQAILFLTVTWGLFLVGTGVARLANSQNPNSSHFEKHGSIVLRIIFGSLAISIPTFMMAVSNSVFGGSTESFQASILAQNPEAFAGAFKVGSSDIEKYYSEMMGYIFYGLIPFGVFAFVSGLNSFVKASDGQQGGQYSLGAGVVKMVAGIALVNGKLFSCSMAATLGANVGLVGFCAG